MITNVILLIFGGALIGLCVLPIVLLIDTLIVHIREKKAKQEEIARCNARLDAQRDERLKKLDENMRIMAEAMVSVMDLMNKDKEF